MHSKKNAADFHEGRCNTKSWHRFLSLSDVWRSGSHGCGPAFELLMMMMFEGRTADLRKSENTFKQRTIDWWRWCECAWSKGLFLASVYENYATNKIFQKSAKVRSSVVQSWVQVMQLIDVILSIVGEWDKTWWCPNSIIFKGFLSNFTSAELSGEPTSNDTLSEKIVKFQKRASSMNFQAFTKLPAQYPFSWLAWWQNNLSTRRRHLFLCVSRSTLFAWSLTATFTRK